MIPVLAVIFAVGFAVGAIFGWQSHYSAPQRDDWRLPGRRRDLMDADVHADLLIGMWRKAQKKKEASHA